MEAHVQIMNEYMKGLSIDREKDKVVWFDILPNSHLVCVCLCAFTVCQLNSDVFVFPRFLASFF